MATYKYSRYIELNTSEAFDGTHHPGEITPHSGIYRCLGCGREDVSTKGHPLPPQNHHQHTVQQGSIRWRLAVFADHQPKNPPG
jgi:hypothetical protein